MRRAGVYSAHGMNNTTLTVVLLHPDDAPGQARATMAAQVLPACDSKFKRGVRRVKVTVEDVEDERSLQQLRFLWGVVYRETSEQARIEGVQYTPDAFHELGKRLFLPRVKKTVRVAGKRRPVATMTIGSTKGLSVRRMSKYIEEFMAWATTDLNVQFSLQRWEGYQ